MRRHLADAGRAAFLVDVGEILAAEVFEGGQHGIGGALPQAAEAGAPDQFAAFFEQVEVGAGGLPPPDLFEQAVHLLGAGAAGDALAAGLGHAELHEELGDVHHAGRFVHHDHAARAHDGPDRGERLVIHRRVEVRLRDTAPRRPAGLDCFIPAPFGNAASNIVENLAERDAHRDLDQPGIADAAGQREHFRPFALRRPDGGEPAGAVAHDRRNVGERLDVVNEGRAAPKAFLRRVRRGGAERAAPALDRRDERGLLSANERAGAEADVDVEAETRAADRGAEQARAFRLADGRFQVLDRERILGADVDEATLRADGECRDRHPFEDAVRVAFEDRAVHERSRVALVRVADDVFLLLGGLGDGRPFQPGRIAGAAASAQAAGDDLLYDFLRTALGDRRHQRAIPVVRNIVLDALGVDDAGVFKHDLLLAGEERGVRRTAL